MLREGANDIIYIMYNTQSTGIWQSVKFNFHQHLGHSPQTPTFWIYFLVDTPFEKS